MTLEKYFLLNDIAINDLQKRTIKPKLLNKFIKQFKYIEVNELWYDDPDNPETNNWIDVEGIGYGWLWLNNRNSEKKQRKSIIDFAIGLWECIDKEYYMRTEDDITTLFMSNKNKDGIIAIGLSNNKLGWW